MAKRPSTPVEVPPVAETTRRELPLVALRETVIFPEMIVPLQVGREKSVAALNAAVAEGGPIALVTQRQAEQEEIEDPSELYTDRHAGQDRPGRPAPGRDGPRDRPGSGPPARAQLHRDRSVPARLDRGAPGRHAGGSRIDPMASGRLERDPERPVYVISVAATLVSAHPRTLRIYEDEGLLCPARTPSNIRLYSENDIRRITWIRHLTRERGVNLAGIRILFELEERLGARILEALYAEGTDEAEATDASATDPAANPQT